VAPSPWTELQADALREVANIGCGRAVNALSRMLGGRRILSELPRSRIMEPGALTDLVGVGVDPLWIARFTLSGDLAGDLICAVPSLSAGELLGDLLSGTPRAVHGSAALSALSEAANIMGSAYLDGLAAFTGLTVVPSPPRVERERAKDLDSDWWSQPGAERGGLSVATWFRGEAQQDRPALHACLVLAPSLISITSLFSALRLSA
jgi:chemotaxis protein CheC